VLGSIEWVHRTDPDLRSASTAPRARGAVALAGVSFLALVVLAVLVATEVSQDLDVAVRDALRPGDEWGTTQVRVDVLVEGLKPRNVAVLLALLGVAVALWRRSWRPAVYVASVAVATGALALGVKLLLQRTDPHHEMTALGGSFPSGHTASVLVAFGLAVLVMRSRARWWDWLAVAAVGAAMAFSLVVQAAHWFTDVVGGGLLAVTILAVASTSTLREPPRHHR
jgi:membrane-associated phospholipid phosphatase